MSIDTTSLQCFIASAETLSFTKAAKRVNKTQSAVSQQVAKLETLLEKILFKRGKALELTNDGEEFLNYAKQIFTLHCETIDHFKNPDLTGTVRFGIPDDYAITFLDKILSEFIAVHPNISLHIECDLTLNLYENFKKGKLDLVLLKMSKPKEDQFAVEITPQKLLWVGNKKLTEGQRSMPLALSPKPCVYRKAALEALNKNNISWRISFSSHSYSGIIAAVRAGIGITLLPKKMIPKDLAIVASSKLPNLQDSQISLLKSTNKNSATRTSNPPCQFK